MKKGAYDLGRKALYYIVVIIIIAILFTYISNSFRKYQITKLSYLNEVTDLVMVNNIIKCISYKDSDTGRIYLYKIDKELLKEDSIMDCLGRERPYTEKSIKLEIDKEIVITQDPYFEHTEYKKEVEYDGKKTTLKISIEKYPKIQ